MFELTKAGERTYYIDHSTIIGIYKLTDTEVCLIDTGRSRKDGERLNELLRARGWELKFILNTHTHIDHLGGNQYLMEKWGCPAYATNIDNAFANYKNLEASYMYGGFPNRELSIIFRHPGPIGFRDIEDFQLPDGLEYMRLPGHSFGMIGVKTCDSVWFLGDSVLNSRALEKYQFGYLVDVAGYLETLELLKRLEGDLFLPSHGDIAEDIRPLAEGNRRNIEDNIAGIWRDCGEGIHFDALLKRIFDRYGIRGDMAQYALSGSTLKCYLSYMEERGQIVSYFEDNILKWKQADKRG